MHKNAPYLFTSARLGFRNWKETDHIPMAKINADPAVMEFFPFKPDASQTLEFIKRMQTMLEERGYCYFAVDELSSNALIGFIGLSYQTYESSFTPCVDIGWRLAQQFWGKGYATEGAERCLAFGFQNLGLKCINSVAPVTNTKSIHIMKKIGMKKLMEFKHPALANDKRLEDCVCFTKIM
jgi:RimJ/RimL family protein N-acetyltransferase